MNDTRLQGHTHDNSRMANEDAEFDLLPDLGGTDLGGTDLRGTDLGAMDLACGADYMCGHADEWDQPDYDSDLEYYDVTLVEAMESGGIDYAAHDTDSYVEADDRRNTTGLWGNDSRGEGYTDTLEVDGSIETPFGLTGGARSKRAAPGRTSARRLKPRLHSSASVQSSSTSSTSISGVTMVSMISCDTGDSGFSIADIEIYLSADTINTEIHKRCCDKYCLLTICPRKDEGDYSPAHQLVQGARRGLKGMTKR
jgi:hypothetical protein